MHKKLFTLLISAFIVSIGALSSVAAITTQATGSDVVLDFNFENVSGNTVYDSSTFGNNGTIYGATATEGKIGKGLQFDGVDDYIVVPHSSSLMPTSAITVEAWVYPETSTQSGQIVMKKGLNSAGGYMFGAWFANPNGYAFETYDTASKQSIVNTGKNPVANTWQHIVGTYDGSTLKNYENGVLKQELIKASALAASSEKFYIGIQPNMLGPFKGKVDELKIYNRALSAQEICEAAQTCAPQNKPPVISGVSGPTTLKVNETGTWSITANDPDGTELIYSVDWGDTKKDEQGLARALQNEPTEQKATFTHSYASAGSYTVSITVSDTKGGSAKSTVSVVIGSALTVLSPTTGQKVDSGSTLKIQWSGQTRGNTVSISLYDVLNSGKFHDSDIARDITNTGNYDWKIPSDKRTGKYMIAVRDPLETNNIGWSGTFSITSPFAQSITVISPSEGETLIQGEQYVIKWKLSWKFTDYSFDILLQECSLSQCASSYITKDFEPSSNISTLADSTAKFAWNAKDILPGGGLASIVDSGKYKILIQDSRNPTISDQSDGTFSIKTSASNKPPVITGVSGPTSLKVNETGTWSVTASDPEKDTLSYKVNWGNVDNNPYVSSPAEMSQTATFTHSYSTAGIYTVTFTVSDDKGASAVSTLSVKVSETLEQKLVLSNIIAEVNGTSVTISWDTNIPSNSDLYYYYNENSVKKGENWNWDKIDDYTQTRHTLTTKNLKANTVYSYVVSSKQKTDGVKTSSETKSFTTGTNGEGDIIFNLRAPYEEIRPTSAVIRWNTTVPNASLVYYAEYYTDSFSWYGTDSPLVTEHKVQLNNLKPFTSYKFYVNAKDAQGNFVKSAVENFTTTNGIDLTIKNVEFHKEWNDPKGKNLFLFEYCNEGTGVIDQTEVALQWTVNQITYKDSIPHMVLKDQSCGKYLLASQLPSTLPAQNYLVSATIDTTKKIEELNENNNTKEQSIYIEVSKDGNKPPVITGVSGPTSLKVNETGTWSVTANDLEGGYLSYAVDWGDTASAQPTSAKAQTQDQKATITHSYAKSGTYTITFTVTDDKGASAKSTLTVSVANSALPDIVVKDITFFQEIEGNKNMLVADLCNYGSQNINLSGGLVTYFVETESVKSTYTNDGLMLKAGECTTKANQKRIFADKLVSQSGVYKVKVIVDKDNVLVEANETNNILTKEINIVLTNNQSPAITSITPTSGPVGTKLTIYGKNFKDYCLGKGTLECRAQVWIGETWIEDQLTRDDIISWNEFAIVVKIPEKTTSGAVRVYRNEIFNWGEPNVYTDTYDITGPVFTVTQKTEIYSGVLEPTSVTIQMWGTHRLKLEKPTCPPGAYCMPLITETYLVKATDDKVLADLKKHENQKVNIRGTGGYYDLEGGFYGLVAYEVSPLTDTGGGGGQIITPPPTTTEIRETAQSLHTDKIDELLAEIRELRNMVREQETKIKYLEKLTRGAQELSQKTEERLNTFITYGVDENTKRLGTGERAAVLYSYQAAFDKLPDSETELNDAILIANGRWPNERSEDAEAEAKESFKIVYLRDPDMDNPNDSAAVMIMAYGLKQQAKNRNLMSEGRAIATFRAIFKRTPKLTKDWNIVQAIAYSGARR